jgi:sodium bicarbonate transporter 10
MIGIRKSLDFLFTRRELKILDDVMPETTKRTEEERRQLEGEVRYVYTLHFKFNLWN